MTILSRAMIFEPSVHGMVLRADYGIDTILLEAQSTARLMQLMALPRIRSTFDSGSLLGTHGEQFHIPIRRPLAQCHGRSGFNTIVRKPCDCAVWPLKSSALPRDDHDPR